MQQEVIPENNPLANKENIDITTATLELTHRNNLYDLKTPITDPIDEELNVNGWIKVIDKLDENGVEKVTLTGGEPTVRNDFYSILGYAINTIGDVTVQTNGTTPTKLSTYRCTVAIEILDQRSTYHNQVLRQTDPRKYAYEGNQGKLIKKEGGKCMYCEQELKDKNGSRLHLKSSHKSQVINDLNDELDLSLETWEEAKEVIRNNPDLGFDFYMKSAYKLDDRENALRKAFEKAEKVERPTILKSTVFENNDVEGVMSMAEAIDASTIFTPLKPVGKARDNFLDQMPSPGRMAEVMNAVNSIDSILSSGHTIDTPMYTAYQWNKQRSKLSSVQSRQDIEAMYALEDKIEEHWNRGRVDDVGASTINVLPNGDVTPSHHLREDILGNLLSDNFENLKENMAKWNEAIFEEKYLRPAQGTDLRTKNIASDLDIVLNNPYKKP